MSTRYEQAYDGEWMDCTLRGDKDMCCGCCLVHKIDYRIITYGKYADKQRIQRRVWTDRKATASARKRAGIKVVRR